MSATRIAVCNVPWCGHTHAEHSGWLSNLGPCSVDGCTCTCFHGPPWEVVQVHLNEVE